MGISDVLLDLASDGRERRCRASPGSFPHLRCSVGSRTHHGSTATCCGALCAPRLLPDLWPWDQGGASHLYPHLTDRRNQDPERSRDLLVVTQRARGRGKQQGAQTHRLRTPQARAMALAHDTPRGRPTCVHTARPPGSGRLARGMSTGS